MVRVIKARIGAADAITCYRDHAPPATDRPDPVAARDQGAGRPRAGQRVLLDKWQEPAGL